MSLPSASPTPSAEAHAYRPQAGGAGAPREAAKKSGHGHEREAGLFHHLIGWCGAMLNYAKLRSELALAEAKEAGAHYGIIVGLFAGALIVVLFAYVFLVLTVVFALAELMDGQQHVWLKILGGATGVHLLLAVVLVLLAKARLKAGVFEKTKEEFRKDKLWPKNTPHLPGEAKQN